MTGDYNTILSNEGATSVVLTSTLGKKLTLCCSSHKKIDVTLKPYLMQHYHDLGTCSQLLIQIHFIVDCKVLSIC